jgi:hypothetical protein
MAVDERGERSQILLFHLLNLLRLREYLLNQQGIDILSRDFAGTEKTDVVDHVTPRHMTRRFGDSPYGQKSRCVLTPVGDLCHTGCSVMDFIS